MSDDYRGQDLDGIKDRLARVETKLEDRLCSVEGEILTLRRERHAMASSLQSVVTLQEEARDARVEMSRKIDQLSSKIEPISATLAQVAATVAGHVAQCIEDKRDDDARMRQLETEQQEGYREHNRYHLDNLERFSKLNSNLKWIAGVAIGLGIALSAIINHGALFAKMLG